jgi:diguanylate cyclase (GGDEF)-like protein
MSRVQVRIGFKLMLGLAALLATTVVVSWVALAGLTESNDHARHLYDDNLLTTQVTTELGAAIEEADHIALRLLVTADPVERTALQSRFTDEAAPRVEDGLVTLRNIHADDPKVERDRVGKVADGWVKFEELVQSGALHPVDQAALRATNRRLTAILDPVNAQIEQMVSIESSEAKADQAVAERVFRVNRAEILLLAGGAALIWAIVALALVRNIVPRVHAYSRFAAEVAGGSFSGQVRVKGSDELAELGRTLNAMVSARAEQGDREAAQAEFVDALQRSETEAEAHDLLKRHLERSIGSGRVTILNRNNSADRLEAATAVEAECPLSTTLEGAKPRSCLAVRFGRNYEADPGRAPLLDCAICASLDGVKSCEPLLVSGEVIGSVLVTRPGSSGYDPALIRETVTQAAPVLANLRNLAIAEVRAATDALTGLPNNRAVQDTVRRMVAQASRSVMPLSAALLDLDHFKQVNDAYGHSRGDEVLATVATAISSSLRESDFVGRYGGEEFVILLPDTGKEQARIVAEKVRAAVAATTPPGLERPVTASLGVATAPDDAGDAESLVRAADRALYAAKRNGRDRVELFVPPKRQRAES